MSRDLYSSVSGAISAWKQIETVANNLANVNTTGFKALRLSQQTTGPGGKHPLGKSYVEVAEQLRDERDGAVNVDGVPTHLALQGLGFFVIGGSDGPVLTRDGRFSLSAQGELVDATGANVLGQSGNIEIPRGETFQVTPDGRVLGSKSGEIDRLQIVMADVRPLGSNRWAPDGPLMTVDARVVQGAVENSNVDPLVAMIELVEASRYFEIYQKAIQASDELDARLNQIGGK